MPSEQKKIAKEILKDSKKLILTVSKKENLEAFISKISRYKTHDELYNALKVFSKDTINEKEKVLETLKSLKSEIKYDNNNLLIVAVDSYEDIKILGSDTSWCIVGSKSTYDSYAKGRFQYILYNYNLDEFNPEFKIGFTVSKDNSLYAAHDILDNSVRTELGKIFRDNEIEFDSLRPKREPVSLDFSKIKSSISYENLENIIDQCPYENMPDLISRICKIVRPEQKKAGLLKKCYKIYYGNKDYVLSSDISKISDMFLGILYSNERLNKNLINVDKFSAELKESAFIKALDVWKPIAYYNLEEYYLTKRIIKRSESSNVETYSKETLLKLSDILNTIYKNNDLKFKDNGFKGVKYSKEYECFMLVLNTFLERKEETPDYEKIVNSKNTDFLDFIDILKLPIDLNDMHLFNKFNIDDIELIIKKDYSTPIHIYAPNSKRLNIYVKLAKHLKDFKLTYTITKDMLKEFDMRPGYYQKDDNTLLTDIFSRFDFTSRKPKHQEITEGNLTVKFIV
jgi:hypothetical protein